MAPLGNAGPGPIKLRKTGQVQLKKGGESSPALEPGARSHWNGPGRQPLILQETRGVGCPGAQDHAPVHTCSTGQREEVCSA